MKYRFGDFELNPQAFELRRNGSPIKLERLPMDLLILLLERRGVLVSRSEIVERLWGKNVFVDVDLGVNTAIRKIRQVLGDDRGAPRFVETVPGRGYRFVVPVIQARDAEPATYTRMTLAVLPFENLSGDADRDYLADGLTEEVIAAVGRIDPEHLAVIGRTSVNRYKKTSKTLGEIGAELNSAYLLESSIRAEGGRLRVTSRLVTASDQVQRWAATYDSEPSSILALQRELSAAIAQQVRLQLLPERMSSLALRQSLNSEAYDMYLRGRYYWNQLTPPTTRRALEYYRNATEIDPQYALAWCGLADAYASSPIHSDINPRQVWTPAKEAAEHAVSAAAELAESQISRGFVNLFLNWDWPAAQAAFQKACELDGNSALAFRMLGVTLSHRGKNEEAIDCMRRARELDPLYAMHYALSTMVAFHAGDLERALELGRQGNVVDPDFWVTYFQLAQVYERAGKRELALEALANAGRLSGGNSKVFALRGFILAAEGRHDEAREVIETLASFSKQRYVPPYATALIYAGLGETDAAFTWLDRAFEARDVHLIFLPVDPKWHPFRTDPRFQGVLQRCGFA